MAKMNGWQQDAASPPTRHRTQAREGSAADSDMDERSDGESDNTEAWKQVKVSRSCLDGRS
jgi:hypothetical protein